MKKVTVTGAYGFIGRNLCAELAKNKEVELLKIGSKDSIEDLSLKIREADIIFHLAGVNRPKTEEEFKTGNHGFSNRLIKLIEESGKKIPVVFTSSTQAELDNPYGRSKAEAEKEFILSAEKVGNPLFIYRLPNVFGKWCRPNYNSVVATWCYNLAHDLDIQINDKSKELTLVYIDDIVKEFVKKIDYTEVANNTYYHYVNPVFQTNLGELANKLRRFKENRETLIMPSLESDFDRYLYSTYLSYLDTNNFSYKLDMKLDNRGWLAEFIKSDQMGQIFVSKTRPGITRGNHWHHTKVEKFLVIEGEAVIKFRHIENYEVIEYHVSGDQLEVVDIPPGYTHSITNIGEKEVTTLFWANELFDPNAPDTTFLEV